ncbi:MBOAT family O-acyltransferase [Sphingomonas hylomeconis]|uniref:Probable alginate O-acetylase AlgI n=1 Tax=Sphingomonas hylomeconis TaxID=1395958 RepID=A0ABV7T009_9SPHN|nr:MBOAT family O-acyltransferase [Sphingomonas hylomeconis]
MSFTEPTFLFGFLPIVLAAFWTARRLYSGSGAVIVLVAGSFAYCASFGLPFFLIAIIGALLNYFALQAILSHAPMMRKAGLISGLSFNLGSLALLKYSAVFTFFAEGAAVSLYLSSLVPITISFFSFQRSVFLLDAYRGGAEFDVLRPRMPGALLSTAAYLTFFPYLLIGPISYAKEILPQLKMESLGVRRKTDIEVGSTLIVIGLFKKLVLADTLGQNMVDPVFAALQTGQVSPIDALIAILAYYVQLYFDFSGYSDIAIGLARLFGVRLPINFNSPLRSTGIVDFYKRWHITLTRVIARFLYSPLSLSGTRFVMRRKLAKLAGRIISTWLPLLVNFTIIGLWHGPKWTFVAFGVIHGLWFIFETEIRLTARWKRYKKRTSENVRRWHGQLLTVIPLMLTFALFRSQDLQQYGQLIFALQGDWSAWVVRGEIRLVALKTLYLLPLAYGVALLLPNAYEFLRRYRPGLVTFPVSTLTPKLLRVAWRPNLLCGLLLVIMSLAVIFQLGSQTPFVYGGF